MIVKKFQKFLTAQEDQLPDGKWTGVSIHPSSEVDLVEINGYVLSVGSVMPLSGNGTALAKAVRQSLAAPPPPALSSIAAFTGELLALQLYECGDPLIAPGDRAPQFRSAKIPFASLAGNAYAYCFRLPFQGRQMARVSVLGGDTANNVSVVMVGINRTVAGQYVIYDYVEHTETWWNGAAVAPAGVIWPSLSRTFYIGGEGDDVEGFDAIDFYLNGTQASGTSTLTAEVMGERR